MDQSINQSINQLKIYFYNCKHEINSLLQRHFSTFYFWEIKVKSGPGKRDFQEPSTLTIIAFNKENPSIAQWGGFNKLSDSVHCFENDWLGFTAHSGQLFCFKYHPSKAFVLIQLYSWLSLNPWRIKTKKIVAILVYGMVNQNMKGLKSLASKILLAQKLGFWFIEAWTLIWWGLQFFIEAQKLGFFRFCLFLEKACSRISQARQSLDFTILYTSFWCKACNKRNWW